MATKSKLATDALCEILRDLGHGCREESECWKKAACPEADKMVRALRSQAGGEIRYPDDFGPGSIHAESLAKDCAQQAKGE